jgi:GNAT superfamily N-acetyltransferase
VQFGLTDADTTRELRRAVLRPGWPVGSTMHGDDDPAALHFAAFDGAEVVGACLILPRQYPERPELLPAWQLRGMATAASRRRSGIGGRLLTAVLAHLASLSARILWCEARDPAIPFYERHGFEVDGAGFAHAETGIAHHHMWRPV